VKIKLLTFSKASSYGAVLQCFALSRVLENMGHDIELIDLPLQGTNYEKQKRFIDYLILLIHFPTFYLRLKEKVKFHNLRKKLSEFRTKQFPQYEEYEVVKNKITSNFYNEDNVCFIVGSDQVWNPDLTKGLSDLFFLSFVPARYKKIAYAASFGIDIWNYKEQEFEIGNYLKEFNAISIRETSGVDICANVFNLKAQLVLDPTLLLDNYNYLIGNDVKIVKNAVIGHKFVVSKGWYELLKYVAKTRGIKRIRQNIHNDILSVEEWIKTIAESDFVVTDSFHVMVFSIIFRKEFIILPSYNSRSGRMLSLLDILDLRDRYYEKYEDVYSDNRWIAPIDYNRVHDNLKLLRQESMKFLKNALLS